MLTHTPSVSSSAALTDFREPWPLPPPDANGTPFGIPTTPPRPSWPPPPPSPTSPTPSPIVVVTPVGETAVSAGSGRRSGRPPDDDAMSIGGDDELEVTLEAVVKELWLLIECDDVGVEVATDTWLTALAVLYAKK